LELRKAAYDGEEGATLEGHSLMFLFWNPRVTWIALLKGIYVDASSFLSLDILESVHW